MVRSGGDLGSLLVHDSVCDAPRITLILNLNGSLKLHPHLLYGSGNTEDGKLGYEMASEVARGHRRSHPKWNHQNLQLRAFLVAFYYCTEGGS